MLFPDIRQGGPTRPNRFSPDTLGSMQGICRTESPDRISKSGLEWLSPLAALNLSSKTSGKLAVFRLPAPFSRF